MAGRCPDPEEQMSAAECEQPGTGWGILEDLPGDPMIWVLIFSELAAFGLFLGALVVTRAIHPAVFAEGRRRSIRALPGSIRSCW